MLADGGLVGELRTKIESESEESSEEEREETISLYNEEMIERKPCYDGEFLNGAPGGFGRMFSEEGQLIYLGHFVDGVPHGTGKTFNPKTGNVEQVGQFYHGTFQSTV